MLLYGLGSLHRSVVYASHTDGVEDRLLGHLLHSVFPELEHVFPVMHKVILSLASCRPFASRARSHRLAMGTADVDAILLGHLSVALSQEERLGAFVHRWPIGVGTKTEQQLEDASVGLRTDMPLDIRWLVGLARPGH